MKSGTISLLFFGSLAAALPLVIPGTSGDSVQIIERLERRNGEWQGSREMAYRVSAQRDHFGLEYTLEKRKAAPEAAKSYMSGSYVDHFLARTMWLEENLIKDAC